ncbi:nucleotide-sugar transporter-domain-containing protein [Chytridium lagenaria]|nr:nucleotide-sugar transporter-domain-containing protein [Chytridium lagenaria]
MGIPLSYISLVTLVVQNSMLVIVMKYSQIKEPDQKDYLASTAVVMCELLKLVICLVVYVMEEGKTQRVTIAKVLSDLFGRNSDSFKMMVPAALYVLQNNLQYLAVKNLDPATFQVTYQMKILTTALFSVWMLRKTLSAFKWGSLFLLTAGIAMVQLSSDPKKGDNSNDKSGVEQFVGLIAVGVACVLSGLAGVWFEKVLKGSKASLWLRNVQLSFYSLLPGFFIGVMLKDGKKVAADGFFQGYTAWTWGAILCQAIGGLIVALVVKYADNILKGFATSISIILSAIASVFLFDFVISVQFTVGAGMVLYATHMYGLPDKPAPKPVVDLSYVRVEAKIKPKNLEPSDGSFFLVLSSSSIWSCPQPLFSLQQFYLIFLFFYQSTHLLFFTLF